MTKYLWRDGKWVEASKAAPRHRVYVQSDIDTLESPVTGEVIHSRPQYEAHLKQYGYHISEPGDVAKRAKPEGVRGDVKRALQQMGVVG